MIELEDDDGVRVIWLNRPGQMNALNVAMFEALDEAFRDAASDPSISVTVLAGRGEVFCAGADVADFAVLDSKSSKVDHYDRALRLLRRIADGDKPVVAAVHGRVYGAAFEIVLACDFCVAAEATRFAWKEAAVGLIPSVGLVWGPERLGPSWTRLLAYTGEDLDVSTASSLGLVQLVRPSADEVLSTALDRAHQINDSSAAAIRHIRRLTRSTPSEARWADLRDASIDSFLSPEHEARVQGFLARHRRHRG